MKHKPQGGAAARPPGPSSSPPPPPAAALALLQLLRENFVVVSALSVVMGVGIAIMFLSAYLSVFDWHLLWFIQYTDIITFGLIALGIIASSFFVLDACVRAVIGILEIEGGSKRWAIGSSAVLFLLLLGGQLYFPIKNGQPYFHILSGTAAIVGCVFLVFVIVRQIRSGSWPNLIQVTGLVVLVVSTTLGSGRWLGDSVIEDSQFDQDVSLKNETLQGVKVIIVLSRHTVLLKDRTVYVVPTADITKFQTSHELKTINPTPAPPTPKT
jgi:hypothetical protein